MILIYFKSICNFDNNFIKKEMLDKYECFYKLSKSVECSVYTAFNRVSASNVLIKRIKTNLAWNDLLTHKHVLLLSKIKSFPKMNEIFRHKGHFYFVFEKPCGRSLAIANSVEKLSLQAFIPLMADLMDSIWELSQKINNLAILPDWIYFHRNGLKLIHFQPFLNKEVQQENHVATYQDKLNQNPQQLEQKEEINFLPDQYKKCLIFHLGLIAFRFLTGKKQQNLQSKQQFLVYVKNIREICERQIIKMTEDSRMANFITKMLSENKFEVPSLEQVYNFFQAQNREQKKKPMNKQRSLEIQIEKIHLVNDDHTQVKKKARNCCKGMLRPKQMNVNEKIKQMGLKSKRQIIAAKRSSLILPYLSLNNYPEVNRSRNLTCINRHHPFQTNQSQSQSLSNKYQVKSYKSFRNEDKI